MIKCVVWDLDNTLLDGTYLESAEPPPADPAMIAVLAELAARGILQALATRNPPEAAAWAERVTGYRFAAAECGWDDKPAAIGRITEALGLAADAVAFVDDDPVERAEVSFALPQVLVLAPEDMPDAAGWPRFSPAVVTDEARRRGDLYQRRLVRLAEQQRFGGPRDEFLRWCQTRVSIGPGRPAELARLAELSARTRQFNSAGTTASEQELAGYLTTPGRRLVTARLSDRFGDDGLVGACLIRAAGQDGWHVPLLMMSCRAMGRGVIDALLAWLCQAGRQAGAERLTISCVLTPRNVPLRLALGQAGFRAPDRPRPGEPAAFSRPLRGALPQLPSWAGWRDER